MGTSAREVAANTPVGRDRYIDLLRVVSLGTVVFGHWLMAAVTVDREGNAQVGNLLAEVPALQPLTWLLQIMPVFFFVGGFSHALSYRSLERKAEGGSVYAAFLRARLQRLLRPTMVFIAVWGGGALLVQVVGADGPLARVAQRLVAQPLWFIGIYLAMVAFTPPLLRLHERYGVGALAGLVAGAVAVDVLRFALGVPYVEFLNFAFVWLAVHQLGFLRADGRLGVRTVPGGMAIVGSVSGALLVAFGPYPLSMVGMPGEKVSNMAPPTLALLAHGIWLVGAVELLRRPAARLLERERVWRGVVAANGIAMTAFLWHLTAMLGVVGVALAAGVPFPEAGTGAWWAQVPVRVVAAAGVTAMLVALFRRFERPSAASVGTRYRASGAGAALGVVLCLFGVLGLSAVGFAGMLEGHSATLIAFQITAPAAVGLALGGWGLVEIAGRGAAPRRLRWTAWLTIHRAIERPNHPRHGSE